MRVVDEVAVPEWLTDEGEGKVSIDVAETTPAEMDYRVIVAQLYRAGWRPTRVEN